MYNTKMRALCVLLLVSITACSSAGRISSEPGRKQSPENQSIAPSQPSTKTGILQKVGDAPNSANSNYTGLQCVGEQTCWLNDSGNLWKSDNGGRSWRQVYTVAGGQEILSYYFADTQTGWALSSDGLYKSVDGGQSWNRQQSPIDSPLGQIYSIHFQPGGKTGWLAGGIFRPQTTEEMRSGVPNNTKGITGKEVLEEVIFRTGDGGLTWQQQSLSPKLIGRITSVQFFDEDHGAAMGELNIYYTKDGGKKWIKSGFKSNCVKEEYLSDNYDSRPKAIEMLDVNLWWLSYDDGRIIKSVDGGRTWCDLLQPGKVNFDEPGMTFFTKMYFDNPEHGVGLGWDQYLYETKDGGSNWQRLISDVKFKCLSPLTSHCKLAVSGTNVFCIKDSPERDVR
jgi:photosystem II stability/assembly factor-like uncharacterized protein